MASPAFQTAAIMGATGLVGRHLLPRLSARFDSTRVYSRREPTGNGPGIQWVKTDFTDTDDLDFSSVDQVFITFGTTRSQAGSMDEFRRVDRDLPLAFARAAAAAGARRLFLVSAVGADRESWVFYNKVKGELEDALHDMVKAGELDTLVVFRPSLLIGEHPGRMLENLGQMALTPLARFMPATVRPIGADQLARAIVNSARSAPDGAHWLSGKDLWALVDQPISRD